MSTPVHGDPKVDERILEKLGKYATKSVDFLSDLMIFTEQFNEAEPNKRCGHLNLSYYAAKEAKKKACSIRRLLLRQMIEVEKCIEGAEESVHRTMLQKLGGHKSSSNMNWSISRSKRRRMSRTPTEIAKPVMSSMHPSLKWSRRPESLGHALCEEENKRNE